MRLSSGSTVSTGAATEAIFPLSSTRISDITLPRVQTAFKPFSKSNTPAATAAAYGLGVWAGASFAWRPVLWAAGLVRILHVRITQRAPVLRFQDGERGFYVDAEGFIFPLHKTYTAPVPVVEGAIPVDVPAGYKGEAREE